MQTKFKVGNFVFLPKKVITKYQKSNELLNANIGRAYEIVHINLEFHNCTLKRVFQYMGMGDYLYFSFESMNKFLKPISDCEYRGL